MQNNHDKNKLANKNYHLLTINIGCNLCYLRKASHLSQQTISQKIGVSLDDLKNIEAGKKSIPAEALFLAADFFKIDLNAFFKELSADGIPKTSDLNLAINSLKDSKIEKSIIALIKSLKK